MTSSSPPPDETSPDQTLPEEILQELRKQDQVPFSVSEEQDRAILTRAREELTRRLTAPSVDKERSPSRLTAAVVFVIAATLVAMVLVRPGTDSEPAVVLTGHQVGEERGAVSEMAEDRGRPRPLVGPSDHVKPAPGRKADAESLRAGQRREAAADVLSSQHSSRMEMQSAPAAPPVASEAADVATSPSLRARPGQPARKSVPPADADAVFAPADEQAPSEVSTADVNGDGRVDILDAFQLARQMEANGPALLKDDLRPFDRNGDGIIDETDVRLIATEAVKL